MHDFILLFLKGILFGVTMAAVPGPIFFIIVQNTLSHGLVTGLLCALGSICADAVYAFIAAMGLSYIMQFFTAHQTALSLLGGTFLIGLGILTYIRKNKIDTAKPASSNVANAWISIFFLTLGNPATVLAYCILFAGLGLNIAPATVYSTFILVCGVMTGAAIIFILLILFLHFFKHLISIRALQRINVFTAFLLLFFGSATIVRALFTTPKKCSVIHEQSYHIVDAQRIEEYAPQKTARSWDITTFYTANKTNQPLLIFSPDYNKSIVSYTKHLKKDAHDHFVVFINHAYLSSPIVLPTGHSIPLTPYPKNDYDFKRAIDIGAHDIQKTIEFLAHKNENPHDQLYGKINFMNPEIRGDGLGNQIAHHAKSVIFK